MSRTLEQVKEQIRSRFLGHGGIHGVGLSLKQKAIRLYVDPKRTVDCAGTLDQVRQSAEDVLHCRAAFEQLLLAHPERRALSRQVLPQPLARIERRRHREQVGVIVVEEEPPIVAGKPDA